VPELDDVQNDDLINAVFADVRQEVAGYIRPAGAAAAVATVRRRRRNRTIAGAALAVALIAGPAIGLAWAQNRPDGPPDVADPTPSVSASEPAPPSPSTGPSGSPSSTASDTNIPLSQLRNSTLSVPAWPGPIDQTCPSGQLKFTDGKYTRTGEDGIQIRLAGDPAYVDVNGDGRNETVIRVDCHLQGILTQVVAYSRSPDGKISLFGKVVTSYTEGSDVKLVWKIEAGGPTTVRIDVGDYSPCCGIAADYPQHQWRTYGWDGQRFRQTGGPTSFPPNPKKADLGVAATPLAMTAQGGGWSGRLTMTVSNKGPGTGVYPTIDLSFPGAVTLAGPDVGKCRLSSNTTAVCTLGPIAPNSSAQVRLDVTAATDLRGNKVNLLITSRNKDGGEYNDDNGRNNLVDIAIT
jgi:hypothetical protein